MESIESSTLQVRSKSYYGSQSTLVLPPPTYHADGQQVVMVDHSSSGSIINPQHNVLSQCSYDTVKNCILFRGGDIEAFGDEYDGEEDGYDNNNYDDYDRYDSSSDYDGGYDDEGYDRPKQRNYNDGNSIPRSTSNRKRQSKTSQYANLAVNMAKKTANVATSATVSSIKGSTRAAVHLATPKHVSIRDIVGVWRLDQHVDADGDATTTTTCAANVELTPRGDVVTRYSKGGGNSDEEQVKLSPYTFTERSWPRSCAIEFEARAFQGPGQEEPTNMLYKATFRRKLADTSVIKMEGKIYRVSGGNRRWSKKRVELVGTFTARRRVVVDNRRAAGPKSIRQFDDDNGEYDYGSGEYSYDGDSYDDDDKQYDR